MTGMSTRIGYPTEHLAAGTSDDIASPTFATGVGLVIKGLKHLEKQNKAKEVELPKEEPKLKKDDVRGPSEEIKSRGLFKNLIQKGKEFFDENVD